MTRSAPRPLPAPGRLTLLLRLWLGLTWALPGLFAWAARRAHRRQGAATDRLGERLGRATLPRPPGQLVWIHAASVGETVSVAALARLIADRPGTHVLLTTTTATAAQTVAARLPGVLHQFLPMDTPGAVTGFLAHWRPDAALFVEADLWPRMVLTLAARAVPMALLNARPSKTRRRAPRSFARLLRGVGLVTVQDPALMAEFAALGMDPACIRAPGNLKADIAPPVPDPALAAALRGAAAGRAIWAAASTHPGEEDIALDAHAALQSPALLLLVPRHPARGDALAGDLARRGLRVSRQSAGQRPGPQTGVHLLDVIGMMGTVYDVADVALIGGSLVPGLGGHTPYEPAALGCAMITGPYLRNFQTVYDRLFDSGGALRVSDAASLTQAVEGVLMDPAARARLQGAARALQQHEVGASARTLAALAALLVPDATPSAPPP